MTNVATATSPTRPVAPRNNTLRVRAIPTIVFLLVEIVIGNQLAEVGSPYPVGYLAAHVVLSILLVGVSAHLLRASLRLPRPVARFAATFTFGTTLGATLSGTAFLLGGQSNAALYAMEAFGGLALVGAILLMVWGSVADPRPTSAAS